MDMKLFAAAQNNVARGQMKSLKEKIDSNPDLLTFSDRETLLHKAVMSGRAEMVRYLLEQGADPNATDNPYKLLTPLHYAAVGGHLEIVEILLAAGADLNIEDKNGNSALIHSLGMGRGFDQASRAKYERIFFCLIEKGARTNDPERLLSIAASDGYVSIVKYILDELIPGYPASGSKQAGFGLNSSALSMAVMRNQLEVVKLLLDRGAASGPNKQDGQNALREARARNHGAIAEALLEAGISPEAEAQQAAPTMEEAVRIALEQFFSSEEAPDISRRQFEKTVEETVSFAAKMFSGEIFDDIKQWRNEWVADHLARGRYAENETRPLKEVLKDLEAEFSKLDDRIINLFNPGLSDEELKALTKGETWPDDLAVLYRWRNGSAEYAENAVFGRQIFSSLQSALERRAMMEDISPNHYLPIMDDGAGGWIEVDLRADRELAGLTYDLYKEEQDSPTIYPGLDAFFGAVLACFRQGAFKVAPKAGKNGEDLLVGHHAMIDAITARFTLHLPGQNAPEIPTPEKEADEGDGDGISVYDYTVVLYS